MRTLLVFVMLLATPPADASSRRRRDSTAPPSALCAVSTLKHVPTPWRAVSVRLQGIPTPPGGSKESLLGGALLRARRARMKFVYVRNSSKNVTATATRA